MSIFARGGLQVVVSNVLHRRLAGPACAEWACAERHEGNGNEHSSPGTQRFRSHWFGLGQGPERLAPSNHAISTRQRACRIMTLRILRRFRPPPGGRPAFMGGESTCNVLLRGLCSAFCYQYSHFSGLRAPGCGVVPERFSHCVRQALFGCGCTGPFGTRGRYVSGPELTCDKRLNNPAKHAAIPSSAVGDGAAQHLARRTGRCARRVCRRRATA